MGDLMKRLLLLSGEIFIIFVIALCSISIAFGKPSVEYVPGEILIKFKNNSSPVSRSMSINSRAHTALQNFKRNIVRVKLKDGQSVSDAISDYKTDPEIEYVQPNYIYRISEIPDDSDFNQLWGLKNNGQEILQVEYIFNNPGTPGKDMNLESAWEYITDCSSITVAVIDTGINYTHIDLADNMWTSSPGYYHGYDFIEDDNDPMDFNGHGTHVAGIIGAVGNNNNGISGVCWEIKLMAVRALDIFGSGTTASVIPAIEYAVDNGAKVINMSFGGFVNSNDDALFNAMKDAESQGVLIIASAGNNAYDLDKIPDPYLYAPCEYELENIVCVAALDQSYGLANFSNYGKSGVDVGAPGTNIRSSWTGPVIYEDFSMDWIVNEDGQWLYRYIQGYDVFLIDSDEPDYISGDHKLSKQFDFSDYSSLVLQFNHEIELEESNNNSFGVYYSANSEDPFSTIPQYESDSGRDLGVKSLELPVSSSNTSSIGFWFYGENFNDRIFSYIFNLNIYTSESGSDQFYVKNGTSMATPYVSGLAALIWAKTPEYTFYDVRAAILSGGDIESSILDKTGTGRAVDALGSLKYIRKPVGLSIITID